MAICIKACYEQQLAEKEKAIRDLILAGESKTGDGAILRAELRRSYDTTDRL